ncbi:MAG: dephospho-CoA kinase [Bacteroidetes bacterium]|nr:dephospho-CoA kinase [Bacteroidota bacterium]
MIKVGITGGIGSGKSTVCSVFALLGIPVYSSDAAAKNVLEETEVIRQIAAIAGDVLTEDGRIDRKKLADVVFKDKQKLEQLNSIVHPAVARHFETWCAAYKNARYVLKEAAILFESGAYKQVEKIITVTAPKTLKIKRILQRDRISEQQVEERMVNQMNDEEKIKRSDYTVLNDEQELVIPQILQIHTHLLKLAGAN